MKKEGKKEKKKKKGVGEQTIILGCWGGREKNNFEMSSLIGNQKKKGRFS